MIAEKYGLTAENILEDKQTAALIHAISGGRLGGGKIKMKVAETLWEYMMLDALLKPVLDSQIGLTNDTQEIERRNAALKALFAEKALFYPLQISP